MKHLSPTIPPAAQSPERRRFIITAVKAACATTLISLPGAAMVARSASSDLTIQDVIDIILKEIPGAPFKDTVDTIKSGNANNKVTGIVTTMFATVKVIKEAIKINANFIIAHEPTFYNHTDDARWIEKNEIVLKKQALLAKNNITVWRFHDYWHSHRPDGIFYGVTKKAGWEKYSKSDQVTLNIPPESLKNIALHLKASLGISHVRVIGELSKICKTIALMPGAAGGESQITLAESVRPDVLVVGEVHEWETAEYVRDARLLGTDISLIILGHSVSEEPGMEWLVEWLKPKISPVKVSHVPSKDPFTWI